MKHYYLLRLEFNKKNHLIFEILEDVETHFLRVGYLVVEDCRREGKLEDFPFLVPNYYKDESEWDDFRNLLISTIYTFKEIDEDEIDCLSFFVDTLTEFKPSVNPRIDFVVDKSLEELRNNCETITDGNVYYNKIPLYKKLLSNCENKVSFDNIEVDDYNHLSQDK
jgi:hypothetical protein